MTLRTRHFPESNYKAFFVNGKTMRLAIDPTKPITELQYPEFYDIKITNTCSGKCDLCYMNSAAQEPHYEDIVNKLWHYFSWMDMNQRPFQVALGGGNPNEHPDFVKVLKDFNTLEIVPNYTTNGIGITKEVLEATCKYCGGVAITTHEHLLNTWRDAVLLYYEIGRFSGIIPSLHCMVWDKRSIDYFIKCYQDFHTYVKYFVLLPVVNQGRAHNVKVNYEYLFKRLEELENLEQIAFGAKLYPWLIDKQLNISLYEPEILSKFIDVQDMKIYKSSFDLK